MSALNKIAYFQNRRDTVPNKELAKELAKTKDKKGIEEIAENLKKEMKPIEILLEQVKSRADKVGIFKKHEIPKLPDNFLKFYNYDQLTKTYRDWYTEKIKESAGLIPGLGNAISLLNLMNTMLEIPPSLPDFNSAVQNLGQLFIIKLMNNNYSNFILPKIKLDYKNLKMQIDYIYNLDIELDSDIELILTVFKDLKKRGLIVKTGFKFGAHFRAYTKKPEETHAEYLIHVVNKKYKVLWAEISRAVRLAHSVNKEIIFAKVEGKKIDYIKFGRLRP